MRIDGHTEIHVKDGDYVAIDLISNMTNEVVATVETVPYKQHRFLMGYGDDFYSLSVPEIQREIKIMKWLLSKQKAPKDITSWQKIMFNYCRLVGHRLNQDDKCLRCKINFGGLYE